MKNRLLFRLLLVMDPVMSGFGTLPWPSHVLVIKSGVGVDVDGLVWARYPD